MMRARLLAIRTRVSRRTRRFVDMDIDGDFEPREINTAWIGALDDSKSAGAATKP